MKKILIIMLVASLFVIACANPAGGNMERSFVGTWKNHLNTQLIFSNDGTFAYQGGISKTTGSGKYTFTDTHLIFSDTILVYNGNQTTYPTISQSYFWHSENSFQLIRDPNNEINEPIADGLYIKQ